METLFKVAKSNKLVADVAKELEGLWIANGSPDTPEGPVTSVKGFVPSYIEDEELEGLSPERQAEYADVYNKALDLLIEMTGAWNAGGNTWHTYHDQGSESWQNYHDQAWEVVMNFVANQMWDRFCESL